MSRGLTQGPTDTTVHAGLDSVVVDSPVPDPFLPALRAIFNAPTWLQLTIAALLAALALTALVMLWRRRQRIREWLTSRERGTRIALLGVVAAIVVVVAGFGLASWNYMQHDNDFCNGCHIMSTAVDRFYQSEHKKLQCHDCHQQSLYASSRQLVLWVLEKKEEIPPHAKVPTARCAECHIRDDPEKTWQRIVATAGHRVHLESDSSALKDVQCVTCHGLEIHRFAPVDSTCGQNGCHTTQDIKLGKMTSQTSLHCVACHVFTAPASESAPVTEAAQTLVPGQTQCFSCHEMRAAMASFDAKTEPHDAVCGTCHNPHEQERPAEAFATCAASGCHAKAAEESVFHRGVAGARLADCASCHKAHTWKVSDTQCLACHQGILRDVPMPRASAGHSSDVGILLVAQGGGSGGAAAPPPARVSPFSHRRHRDVQCGACHSSARKHGEVTVRTEAQCQSCHHRTERPMECGSCHERSELATSRPTRMTMKLSVWPAARERSLTFQHDRHREVACGACHTGGVSMAVSTSCASCHRDHHEPRVACRFCHESGKSVHTRAAHLGCAGSGCHSTATTVSLQPTRNVCLTCHQDKVDHRPGQACASCHQVQWVGGTSG